jgi:hypothetical protein
MLLPYIAQAKATYNYKLPTLRSTHMTDHQELMLYIKETKITHNSGTERGTMEEKHYGLEV